jgi:hypothetical protein
MRSSWVWLILLVAIVGAAFFFASVKTEQPVQTINVPVNNAA